jgi:hypothetical protein
MKALQLLGTQLTPTEQKQINGGWNPCWNLHGQFGGCKTDASCPLDLPICEPL